MGEDISEANSVETSVNATGSCNVDDFYRKHQI
jgi:hypothetical protein